MNLLKIIISVCVAVNILLAATAGAQELPIDLIKLPPGFKIEIFANRVPNARSMALSPTGTLFVGTRTAGNVYALRDEDHDNRAEKGYVLVKGWNMPNGVAFKDGALYVAEVNRVLRFDDIEKDPDHLPQPVVVNDSFSDDTWHGWKFIRFGPDGKLYVPVGTPCNVCERLDDPRYGSITRMNQ